LLWQNTICSWPVEAMVSNSIDELRQQQPGRPA
jgi:hypothetical protein